MFTRLHVLVEEMRSLDEVHCFQSEALAPVVQVPVLVCPASLVVLGLVVVLRLCSGSSKVVVVESRKSGRCVMWGSFFKKVSKKSSKK